jgi:GNAT superfamily N-acetyltransferase
MNRDFYIRLAQLDDLPALPDIERRAATPFQEYGLADIFATIVTPVEAFQAGLDEQRLWVAVDRNGQLLGFALASVVGGNAHLDELDVLPEQGRRGIGSALVETVCQWARRSGFAAITLTTLSHIPWNAPFYERLGFRILKAHELPGPLRDLLQAEIERGLPGQNRVAMRREL